MSDIVDRLKQVRPCRQYDSAGRLITFDGEPTLLELEAAEEILRLRYELEQAHKWQPIETAPKDGTRFWGRVGDDAIAMLWHNKFEAFVSSWRRMTMAPGYSYQAKGSDEWVTQHDHSPDTHQPTRWMPLPPPPREDGK